MLSWHVLVLSFYISHNICRTEVNIKLLKFYIEILPPFARLGVTVLCLLGSSLHHDFVLKTMLLFQPIYVSISTIIDAPLYLVYQVVWTDFYILYRSLMQYFVPNRILPAVLFHIALIYRLLFFWINHLLLFSCHKDIAHSELDFPRSSPLFLLPTISSFLFLDIFSSLRGRMLFRWTATKGVWNVFCWDFENTELSELNKTSECGTERWAKWDAISALRMHFLSKQISFPILLPLFTISV